MIKNIVFDLGGVLVEWNPRQILKTFPGNPQIIQYIHQHGFFVEYWKDYDKGIRNREEIIQIIAPIIRCSEEDCHEFLEFVKHALVPIEATEEFLYQLYSEGYPLYCLSNMSIDFYEYLKPRSFFQYFTGQIISAIEKMVKPDREIYELLLKRYHLQAHETLFIDDLLPNILAAQEVGLNAIQFSRKKGIYDEIYDRIKKEVLR